MKPIAIISIFLLAITFASCTKDAGPVGKKEITGTVSVKQGSTTAAAEVLSSTLLMELRKHPQHTML